MAMHLFHLLVKIRLDSHLSHRSQDSKRREERAVSIQPEEEKAARGPYKCLQISEGWVSGGWGQALFSGAQ